MGLQAARSSGDRDAKTWPQSLRPQDGSNLDNAATGKRRNAERQRNRLVAILAIDDVIAAQLLLGFRERPIHDRRIAALAADGDGLGTRVELGAAAQAAFLFQLVHPRA